MERAASGRADFEDWIAERDAKDREEFEAWLAEQEVAERNVEEEKVRSLRLGCRKVRGMQREMRSAAFPIRRRSVVGWRGIPMRRRSVVGWRGMT